MNAKERDATLCRVLSAMRRQLEDSKRYKLQRIGESLISSYLQLDKAQVMKMISNLEDKPADVFRGRDEGVSDFAFKRQS